MKQAFGQSATAARRLYFSVSVFVIAVLGLGATGCAKADVTAAPNGADATVVGTEYPELGRNYAVEVSAHCGIKYMTFAGRDWKADNPIPDPGPEPAGEDVASYDGTVSGTAVWVDTDTVHLIVDGLPLIVFHPTTEDAPPCM